jgi:TetR/AcrR family transcriptional regulator
MAAPPEPELPRRTGRPRANARMSDGDPIEEILSVASTLFGRNGVTATTMSQIAAEAGLGQSSLYYYYRSKEDVLAAIVGQANVVPLALMAAIEADGGPPAVQLYRFVRGDVMALCALPFDINEVHRYAAREREQFDRYWRERRVLQRQLAKIVAAGISDKSLRAIEPQMAALTMMSNDEAVQNWYRVETHRRRDPHDIGTFVADLTVGGFLSARGRIASVKAKADQADFRGSIETIRAIQP